MKIEGSIEFSIIERSDNGVVSEMPIRAGIKNPFGVVHVSAIVARGCNRDGFGDGSCAGVGGDERFSSHHYPGPGFRRSGTSAYPTGSARQQSKTA